jgi:hypothetical protein
MVLRIVDIHWAGITGNQTNLGHRQGQSEHCLTGFRAFGRDKRAIDEEIYFHRVKLHDFVLRDTVQPGRRVCPGGYKISLLFGSLRPFVDRRDSLPAADAHRHQRIAPVDAGQFVQRLHGQHRAGRADRMTERNA